MSEKIAPLAPRAPAWLAAGLLLALASPAWAQGIDQAIDSFFATTFGWFVSLIFYFTMTPAPNFAGLRRSPIQQVYQWVRRVQHMTVLSET